VVAISRANMKLTNGRSSPYSACGSTPVNDCGDNMSFGDAGEGSAIGFATARGRNWPTLRQFTVFLENRVGQLLELVRRFAGTRVRIVALSISDAGECAFVRFLLSHPEQGREILERAGLAIIESDLIGVELPDDSQPLVRICTALLQAEVNIIQAYPVLTRPRGRPVVALMVDNTEMGLETLGQKGFTMITEGDLDDCDDQ
jgi:hypothetical protein